MTRVRGWIVALSVLNLVLFVAEDAVGGETLYDCCQVEGARASRRDAAL